MIASEIRQKARENLAGKWEKAALLTLVFGLIMMAISFVSGILTAIPLLGVLVPFALLVIEIPIAYGVLITFLKLKRNESVDYADFLSDGFRNFARSWQVTGHILLKLVILLVLTFVFLIMCGFGTTFGLTSLILGSSAATIGFSFFGFVGIIGYIVCLILLMVKSYLYALSFFIAYDHPEMSAKQAVEESEKLMNGHRWNLFWLYLTFIGWAILCAFTLGIGFLWLIPYIMISFVIFYESLVGKTQVEVRGEVVKENVEASSAISEPLEEKEEPKEQEKKEEVMEENTEKKDSSSIKTEEIVPDNSSMPEEEKPKEEKQENE